MGLFSRFKKNDKMVEDQVVLEDYFTPVEELDVGIPVGNVSEEKTEEIKPEIIFSEFTEPTIDYSSKITPNNEFVVTPTIYEFSQGLNLMSENSYIENNIETVTLNEDSNTLVTEEMNENNEELSNRSFRFFENDSTDYKLTKQKEEITPISGTTNIFSIGKIEAQESFKECPSCMQQIDENADVCRVCGYSFGKVR